ncbi:1977_t:CDS:2 [Entrophospora sp. SA101]|nr:1977_t:CDS:2 [Entrophospora sp. SA101]
MTVNNEIGWNCVDDAEEEEIEINGELKLENVQLEKTKIHMDNINQLYNLYSIKIPVRSTGSEDVFRFIEALLNLRNILIINLTILYHSPKTRSLRLKKSSSTVSSEED